MAATFLLLTLLVQVATAMTARSAADTAVAASTRRIALEGADVAAETDRLRETLERLVPGARNIEVTLRFGVRNAVGIARFQWAPPGPVFGPFEIVVRSEVTRAFPP